METRYQRHHLQQVAAEENAIREEIRAREARDCRETMADTAALDKQAAATLDPAAADHAI